MTKRGQSNQGGFGKPSRKYLSDNFIKAIEQAYMTKILSSQNAFFLGDKRDICKVQLL